MKRILAIILICCLSALGAAYAETPVFTCAATLQKGMEPMTFQVFRTMEITAEDIPIYRVEVATAGGQALPPLTFPSMEGEDGQASLLSFADVNFDGYLDLAAVRAAGTSNLYSAWFVYNPEAHTFEYVQALDSLSSYTLFPGQRLIWNAEHDSAVTGVYSLFVVNGQQPVLFRQASALYDDRDAAGQTLRELVKEYGLDGSETVLLDQTRPLFEDEAAYQASYQTLMEQLWKGADPNEAPLAMSLSFSPEAGAAGDYHADHECAAIQSEQRSGLQSISRSALNDAVYAQLKPCPACCANEQR